MFVLDNKSSFFSILTILLILCLCLIGETNLVCILISVCYKSQNLEVIVALVIPFAFFRIVSNVREQCLF